MSRQFILDSRPDALINIIDATNIERNLYLTLQLIELDRPMVVALNMMDEVLANGGSVDVNRLEGQLGVPVVPISAVKGEGIDELVEHAVHVARFDERPGRLDFCTPDGPGGGAVHRCIHGIASLIEDHAHASQIPVRFAATKLVEGDELVISALHLDKNELDGIEHIISQMEEESGTDRLSALADMRFSFIEGVCQACVTKPRAPALGGDRPRAYGSLHRHPDVSAHHGGGLLAHVWCGGGTPAGPHGAARGRGHLGD